MANTSKGGLKARDRAYFRRRQQNHVYSAIVELFAEEAEKGLVTKKELADVLERSPSQITRWLSAPSNFELDTISDILLALGAEMEHRVVRLSDAQTPSIVHPMLARYIQPTEHVSMWVDDPGPQVRQITVAASAPSATVVLTE